MNAYKATIILLVLAASGCATTSYHWRHNQLSGPAAQQQFNTNQAICTSDAYRTAGPPPRAPQPPPNSTTSFYGQTTQGTNFQGQAQTTYSQGNPFTSAFEQGQAEGRYQNAISAIFNGCMAQKGWSQYAVTR
jgi:hypothetical protein